MNAEGSMYKYTYVCIFGQAVRRLRIVDNENATSNDRSSVVFSGGMSNAHAKHSVASAIGCYSDFSFKS